jgi:arginyl-tRNA synthetase
VLGADGKRLRSREGSSVRLAALLDEAEARAREVLETREAAEESAEVGLAAADRDQLARAIGINAVKYADLRSPRRSGYQFSFDKMLALRGNTAVYLLYALARLRALLRRAERPAPAPAEDAALLAGAHPLERALAAQVTRFHDAVEEATGALAPHVLCEFAYALAEAANAFYRQCRVLGDPREGARLLLVRAAARTLSEALTLLGLEPVERL